MQARATEDEPKLGQSGIMDILGIDSGKAKFDAALLVRERTRLATVSNTEAGLEHLLAWLARHRLDQAAPLHVCMEAIGNYGLDLAGVLCGRGPRVSIVNPAADQSLSPPTDWRATRRTSSMRR